MSRIFIPLAAAALLAGCDGENPFQAVSPDGTTELLDANDPNTDVNSKFAYEPSRNLTMNSVQYDEINDRLIINNIPFDGPDGVYDDVAGARTVNASGQVTDVFQNTENTINGEMQYYAVFVKSDYLEATSAGGQNWKGFGFGGANVNRSNFSTPSGPQGSYQYLGVYAGTRTYADRDGIEIIRGDIDMRLDLDDIDPIDEIGGTVLGTISNRTRDPIGNAMVGDLPNVSLVSVTFNVETGVWEDGEVESTDSVNGTLVERDRGTHSGLIAGPNADELGGYVIFEGVADIQTITFEVVEFRNAEGVVEKISGVDLVELEDIQSSVNAGTAVGTLTVPSTALPTGAVVISTTTDTFEVSTSYNAREVGVFVSDLNP